MVRYIWIFCLVCFGIPLSTSAFAQVGYALADKQSEMKYSPHKGFSYNPFGSIMVLRKGTGEYRVIFYGLGAQGLGGGHVQVTAHGSSQNCNVWRWHFSKNIDVDVKCYSPKGLPADSQFTVLAGWPGTGLAGGSRPSNFAPIGPMTSAAPRPPCRGPQCPKSVQGDISTLYVYVDDLSQKVDEIRTRLNALGQ